MTEQPDWFLFLQRYLSTPVMVPDSAVIDWDRCHDRFLVPLLRRLEAKTSSPHPAIMCGLLERRLAGDDVTAQLSEAAAAATAAATAWAATAATATAANNLAPAPVARPFEEWHEDDGPVMCWRFPIEEPPYTGCPLDTDWDGYYTHWTPLVCPADPTIPAEVQP